MSEEYVLSAISISIIALSCIIFLVPNSVSMFSFSGQAFLNGEVWRLLTFIFTHISAYHLFENAATLLISMFLAYEFGLRGRQFLLFFMGCGIFLALIEGLLFPGLVIAGASMSIYAIFGALSIKGSNLIPKYVLIPLFILSIFVMNMINLIVSPSSVTAQSLSSSMFHFAGFATGIGAFCLSLRFRRKKRLLQNMSEPPQ